MNIGHQDWIKGLARTVLESRKNKSEELKVYKRGCEK